MFFSNENYFFIDKKSLNNVTPSSNFFYFFENKNNVNFNFYSNVDFYCSNSVSSSQFTIPNEFLTQKQNLLESETLETESLENETLIWNIIPDLSGFLYLKRSSFTSFFINNSIDVPICFKKSKSLKSKSFELVILKFFNLVMRQGKKLKVISLFFSALVNQFNFVDNELIMFDEETPENQELLISNDWLTDVYFFNTFLKNYFNKKYSNLFFTSNLKPNTNELQKKINRDEKLNTNDIFFKNQLYTLLSQVVPVFSYFIYSVDKNIRKYSRGKSGKYVFVWKYVAPYKRIYVAMRHIAKEIKFRQEIQLSSRFLSVMCVLSKKLQTSLVWKSKNFSHTYVFKNFKKTLMSNLKTLSK